MRVLAWGTYDARSHPRIGVLIEGLRAHGVDLREVQRPLGLSTAQRVQLLQQPWRLPLMAFRLVRCWLWLGRHGRRAARAHAPDVILVGYLGHFDVLLARLLFRRATIAHDMLIFAADTAKDRGAGTVRQRLLRGLDRLAIAASDIVVVDTDEHAAMLPAASRAKACVVPVGVPAAWLAQRSAEPHVGPNGALRVVFFGLFTPLQGAVTIGEAAGLLADHPAIRITMIGSGQDLPAARRAAEANPTVQWIPWVDPEELPAVVAAHDVCLGIFGAGDKAQRVVPNKVFQGAAVGCALVTSDTPPQRRALGAAACFVPAGDPAALAAALRELSTHPEALSVLRRDAAALAAARFSPEAVIDPLLARLGDRHP